MSDPFSTDASPYRLPPAQLRWGDDGAPESAAFDDVYFSRASGVAETEHVFLQHNRLEQRWRALDPAVPGLFTIAETGFGTGLNFLCAWDLWRRCAPASWQLQFISAEHYPLDRAQLARALAAWPQFAAAGAALLTAYPPRVPGFHLCDLGGGVRLQLLFGDAGDRFAQLPDSAAVELPAGSGVDAWFLDGFAPAKNPAMWSEALFAAIARLSRPGTTFATFTAAGAVRRALTAAGFRVQKVAGFGSKREMLCGELEAAAPPAAQARAVDYWALPPAASPRQPVVVIGGGLAGTASARALAERGWPVTLLERAPALAAGASGNPRGVLYTKLSARDGALSRFALAGYLHALRHYRQHLGAQPDPAVGDFCGVLQLAESPAQWQALAEAFAGHGDWVQCVAADTAAQLAGCPVPAPALWFPRAGWLAPARVCAAQAGHPLIDVRLGCAVHALQREGEGWLLHTAAGPLRAGVVVIATAAEASALLPGAELPLQAIRGQITTLPAQRLRCRPRVVICHDGYLLPGPDGGLHIGATFDRGDADGALRAEDHRRNLAALAQALPGVLAPTAEEADDLGGRVGWRCAAPDFLPLVGAVPDSALLREYCAPLARNARALPHGTGAWLPGLYLNVGHGSRGLTSTPLCAELLAALITGAPRPLPRELVQALSPARFAVRALVRGR